MTLDTKLREASSAVRTAREQGEFTSKAPGSQRRRPVGATWAWVAGLAVLLLLGIPALMTAGPVDQQKAGSGTSPAPSDNGPAPVAGDFPYLALIAYDWYPANAEGVIDDLTGGLVAVHVEYSDVTDEGGAGVAQVEYGDYGIWLRLQSEGQEYPEFIDLMSMATSRETLRVRDRDLTLYTISDDPLAQGGAITYAVHWTEAPGVEAVMLAWGLDRVTVLDLIGHLERIGPDAWVELLQCAGQPGCR